MLSRIPRFGSQAISRNNSRSRTLRRWKRTLTGGFERLEPRQLLAGDLVISEFLASNDNGIRDEDFSRPDWIEVLNTAETAVNLDGWFLTDDADDLDQWRFPEIVLEPRERLTVFASGKGRGQLGRELHTNFQLGTSGEYLALVEPDGVSVAFDFGLQYPPQVPDVSFGMPQAVNEQVFVDSGASVQFLVPTPDNGGDLLAQTWTSADFDDSSWTNGTTGIGYERTQGYDELIGTNVEAEMFGVNASVYLRLPFSVVDPGSVSALTLGVKYDDGYVAYINGQEVARRNAPEELTWDAEATDQHRDRDAVVFEDAHIDVGQFDDLLTPGENVLAIHALNSSASSSDFVVVPRLVADVFGELQVEDRQYFTAPSPRLPNGVDSTKVLVGVSHDPIVPSEQDSLTVTATVSSTVADDSPVTLYYRVMYDDEMSVPMLDDGLNGDVEAGDGIYRATIPAGVASAGQMIRYRITAGEAAPAVTRFPLFINSLDREEYHGTMMSDPAIASNLPVMHLFLQEPDAADTTAGTRGSLFYDGELYDNIHADAHGHTTLGFDKKSKDIFFTRDHRFRIADDVPRLKDINILTNYGDPTKLRTTLAYGSYREIGTPSHMAFPIRMQQNGEFLGIFDYVEDGDDEFLEREGLDPRGAFYKMDNSMDSASAGAEKKTRTEEGNADLQALIDGARLTGADRTNFLFDNVDIAAMVNYLTGLVLTGETDCCRRNYYAFRDTQQTGLWQYIPWDVDKSFGKTDTFLADWSVGTGNVFAGRGNTLIDALLDTPEIRKMYLRRLRSVLDEFLQPAGTAAEDLKFEQRVDELADQLASDVSLDTAAWGSLDDSLTWREHVDLHKSDYFPARRNFIYSSLRLANGGLEIAPQVGAPQILFGAIDYNPDSGNQDEEFIELSNPNDVAVDISGWQLTGGVQHTFHPGTVLPAGGTLYVSPNINAFKSRVDSITGGQGLFVQGNYTGHISNHGTTVRLVAQDGAVVDDTMTPTDLTAAQQFVRVSEVMYHPQDSPTGARFVDDDYEFLELINTSTTQTINLQNITLSQGIHFTFPAMMLAPGERVVVVRDRAAFAERYGTDVKIAGQFGDTAEDYKLSNSGESLRLEIASGDIIQQFSFDDQWYRETDGGGPSLEFIDPSLLDLDSWNDGGAWRPSPSTGGSPGTPGIRADFNEDGVVNATDIDLLQIEVRAGIPTSNFDLTSDGVVNQDDIVELVSGILNTQFGDTDLDGDIDAVDLNQLGKRWLQADVTGWSNGDFNGDGRIDDLDLAEVTTNWQPNAMPAMASLRSDDRLPNEGNPLTIRWINWRAIMLKPHLDC